jgi:hypothetical protein
LILDEVPDTCSFRDAYDHVVGDSALHARFTCEEEECEDYKLYAFRARREASPLFVRDGRRRLQW